MEGLGEGVKELLHELSVLQLNGHPVEQGQFVFTNYMLFLLIAFGLTAVFFMIASRQVALVPRGIGNVAEALVEFVRNSIVTDIMGPQGAKYFPLIGTLFFFILFNNFLGLIPGAKPGTGTIGTTLTYGVIVFVIYNAIGVQKNGVGAYIKSFVPSGTPIWLVWLIFPLEIISHFLRPITLGVRLYANMYAGHIVLGVFVIFVKMVLEAITPVGVIVGSLSFVMLIIMYAFEVFVAFIQAYVFSILTTVYINGALHAKEH